MISPIINKNHPQTCFLERGYHTSIQWSNFNIKYARIFDYLCKNFWCYTSFKIILKIMKLLKKIHICIWNEPNVGLCTLQNWHIMNKSEAVCYSPSWEYSEYWIISSWVSTSHIGSEVCVPTREKNMRLVCCLIWLLPKALAAAVEKIRILKSGAWTLFWLKNALELENTKKSLER